MQPALAEVTKFVSQTWTLNISLERPAEGGKALRTRSIIAFGHFVDADEEAEIDDEEAPLGSLILIEKSEINHAGTVGIGDGQLEVEIPVLAGDIDCLLALLTKAGEEDPPVLVVVFEAQRGAQPTASAPIDITLAGIQVEMT